MLGSHQLYPELISPATAEQWLLELRSTVQMGRATIHSHNSVNESIRKSWTGWPDMSCYAGIARTVTDAIQQVNRDLWGFHMSNYAEWQLTRYDGGEGGHYHGHIDCDTDSGLASCRKISAVLNLSDPSTYTDGNLTLEHVGNPDRAELRKQGSLIVFPSFLGHMVSPVTSGTRWSLVTWHWGPTWR